MELLYRYDSDTSVAAIYILYDPYEDRREQLVQPAVPVKYDNMLAFQFYGPQQSCDGGTPVAHA